MFGAMPPCWRRRVGDSLASIAPEKKRRALYESVHRYVPNKERAPVGALLSSLKHGELHMAVFLEETCVTN